MAPQVLLVTSRPSDPHVRALEQKLAQRRALVARFDPRDVPQKVALRLRTGAGKQSEARLSLASGDVELAALNSLWWFRAGPASAPDNLTPEDGAWALQQAEALLAGLWEQLDCRFVPGPRKREEAANLKVHQLGLAARLGFRTPATLVTHVPEDLLRFYEEHSGQVVSKVLSAPRIVRAEGEVRLAYTHLVTRRDLLSFGSLAYAPTMLQAYVPKRVELRLTVVGEVVFAAELHTQESENARFDSRHLDPQLKIQPHVLDPEVARRCLAMVRSLGLHMAAIDLIITPEGEHVFLEINPGGQWWWIEERTGLPISDALADLLLVPHVRDVGAL